MVQIELGERLTEPPVRDRPLARSWLAARSVRLGAVLALLLGTLGAAGRGFAPIPEATIPARLGVSVLTGADQLFVIDPVDPTGEPRQQVGAYRLPDAAPLWRVRMPVPGPFGGYALVGDTLVLASDWGSTAPRRTVGVDARTGVVSWLRPGQFETVTASGDVLLWVSDADADVEGSGGPDPGDLPDGWGSRAPGTLRAVVPDSGEVRWSVALPAGTAHGYAGAPADPTAVWFAAPGPDVVLVRLPDGRLELRDLADGRVRRSVELPRSPTGDGWQGPPAAVGDFMLVPEGPSHLTAYGLERFERRWTIDWEVDRQPWPQACGALLCAFRPEGGVRVLDRRTGASRWADERWSYLTPIGSYLIASHEARPSLAAGLAVVDPPTGRVLGELGAWQLLGAVTGDAAPAGGGPADRVRLLGIRSSLDGRTWVAELDPATATARPLVALPGISGDCQYGTRSSRSGSHGVLVCRRLNGDIGIWRLPA
ncbi:PQQ-binding-like beta-propeller repeat protein [Micromonospora sp. NPDC050397]|uniref:outer membrane protein assembly factor BamB family protein n=1 Tax=Micromonospora sp. NPDC050397 TaxID=3364279 RepID=UPI00384D2E43